MKWLTLNRLIDVVETVLNAHLGNTDDAISIKGGDDGMVYRKNTVVYKLYRKTSNQERVQNLVERELKASTILKGHPNIIPIISTDIDEIEHEGETFLTLQYAFVENMISFDKAVYEDESYQTPLYWLGVERSHQGELLMNYTSRYKLTEYILAQALNIVEYLKQQNIYHRDIDLCNIGITKHTPLRLYLYDFARAQMSGFSDPDPSPPRYLQNINNVRFERYRGNRLLDVMNERIQISFDDVDTSRVPDDITMHIQCFYVFYSIHNHLSWLSDRSSTEKEEYEKLTHDLQMKLLKDDWISKQLLELYDQGSQTYKIPYCINYFAPNYDDSTAQPRKPIQLHHTDPVDDMTDQLRGLKLTDENRYSVQ